MNIVRYKQGDLATMTDERKAELRALAERPDSEIDYSDIPKPSETDWSPVLTQSDLRVHAVEVFGDDGSAWMTKPHDLLGGKTPMEYASNQAGAATVRQILNAIRFGGVV